MAKLGKKASGSKHQLIKIVVDPKECPFREFRDQELSNEFWGLGPAALRASQAVAGIKPSGKSPTSTVAQTLWSDEQTQPLPSSVREYLHEWVRAEDLAMDRWEAEVVIFEDMKMTVIDMQLSHAQVLRRSSFCRKVLSACYMLERTESLTVEQQWEGFNANFGPEGWRARYHIYSPGMKPGGGVQHRPGLSKSGCYLVRLYFLGAWRCVWVSDQVPVDAIGSPLLPFSPLLSHVAAKSTKAASTTVTSGVVHLWPLLLCKALLKLAAPDMSKEEDDENMYNDVEDEEMPEFDILHALTGCMSQMYYLKDPEAVWKLIVAEVPLFTWDDDDEAMSSTMKTKSTKKMSTKDTTTIRQRSLLSILIEDTYNLPPYTLPGISPGHSMSLMVTMARDLPLKKPLPEPDVPLWKTYRWVDWARSHGLYEAYDCPRTRFLKVNGLLKMSYAPHLLDVQSTESITMIFREEHSKTETTKQSKKKEKETKQVQSQNAIQMMLQKEEAREWVQFTPIQELTKFINVLYYPSHFEFTSAVSSPLQRVLRVPNRTLDIPAPKGSPLYFSIDGPDENYLKMSLSILHPRILLNCGVPIEDPIEKAHVFLEVFEWFLDTEVPLAKAFTQTRGYDSVEVCFKPGRHFCRLWVHSRTNWHVAMLSESTILLGTRDVIQTSATKECPWTSKFLNHLGVSFNNWIRSGRSVTGVHSYDKEFYQSYQPDLVWDNYVVGYDKALLHWMFRQALQSFLYKRLQPVDFDIVCGVLRKYFNDPDFGFPPKPKPPKSLQEIIDRDPCDCVLALPEQLGEEEQLQYQDEQILSEHNVSPEEKPPTVDDITMSHLLKPPPDGIPSIVCELATDEVPCGLLKEERDKIIRKHEAATLLQACWRGKWARKCLMNTVVLSPEIIKLLNDNAFGNLEVLSALMNEFFLMYPGAKYAYSVASALGGSYGLNQYTGIALMTSKCKWIPYFQGVFYCHASVKVHFDIQSSIEHSLVTVYDNDTGDPMPQAYSAHITFDFEPNIYGYTVMGHGSVNRPTGSYHDIHWQLTVMTSVDHVFHVCDNMDTEGCNILPLPGATKLHIDEFYIPNRRNILGGVQIAVTRVEAVSFRASTSRTDLEIEAILRTKSKDGIVEELGRCRGKGDICWPYIRLKPNEFSSSMHTLTKKSYSQNYLPGSAGTMSPKGKAKKPNSAGLKSKSTTKLKVDLKAVPNEPKIYTIEVIATNGWPLPLAQWRRVDEVRNMLTPPKVEVSQKKGGKDKAAATKEKKENIGHLKLKEDLPIITTHQPLPDDAYTELECSTAIGGGAFARRDDERDLLFAIARRSWEMKQPGRNQKGEQLRQEFREEFLVQSARPVPGSIHEVAEEGFLEEYFEEESKAATVQGPTPASEVLMVEELEAEEEILYHTMPEPLREKFVPLYFVPHATKELDEEGPILLTPEMIESAKEERAAHLEAGLERMRELQAHNETYVLGAQKRRLFLLEGLLVDGAWNTDIATVLEERDEAIQRELLENSAAANKKKQDAAAAKKTEVVKKKK